MHASAGGDGLARVVIYVSSIMLGRRLFTRKFSMFRSLLEVGTGLAVGVLPAVASAAPATVTRPSAPNSAYVSLDNVQPGQVQTGSVCSNYEGLRCFAHVHATKEGRVQSFVTPKGFGPPDLQAAYQIPSSPVNGTPTVAIVDAFGYTTLESDLAAYRSQYGLPECSTANGCLTILNQSGSASPLPGAPPTSDDWTIETALDVDMVSAACPACNITVVQATDDMTDGLFIANNIPSMVKATVISNSWGGPEAVASPATANENYFMHPGAAIFVSAGDNGYDDAGMGPDYPATSQYVISVGGTNLVKDTSTRGWHETAWSVGAGGAAQGAGGSACSLSIPKPVYQNSLNTPCNFKATTDIAAVADPQTGVAVYNSPNGGWIVVGGTSAASPLTASIFAVVGLGGTAVDGSFVAANAAKLNDVTSGTNGTCGNILCTATAGWDGPTGFGTPNAMALVGTSSGGGGGGGSGGGGGGGGGGTGGAIDNDVVGGCSAAGGDVSGFAVLLLLGAAFGLRRKLA